jgi:hypothetical protein
MSRHPVSARKASFIDRLADALLERFDPALRSPQSSAVISGRDALAGPSLDIPTYLRRGIRIPGVR